MNDQQRAAMQMALDTLIDAQQYYGSYELGKEAITALREALAQPQDNTFISYDDPAIKHVVENDELYIRGYEAGLKAQPQGEPVAWGCGDTQLGRGNRLMMVRLDKGQDGCTIPLYATPPSAALAAKAMRDKAVEICFETFKVMNKFESTAEATVAHSLSNVIAALPIPEVTWVDLTDDEVVALEREVGCFAIGQLGAVLAKFKEKNTPPVVNHISEIYMSSSVDPTPTYFVGHPDGTYSVAEPQPSVNKPQHQREPKAWFRYENGVCIYYETKCFDDLTPLYT